MTDLRHFEIDGRSIAYRMLEGSGPTLLLLPGYASDMEGTKALALHALAERRGWPLLRFDYSGTGASGGRFEDGTLDRWIDEAAALIDALTGGPLVLVGSSMGGWIALHIALRLQGRIQALLGIAVAPDFTDWGFSDEHKAELRASGRIERGGQLTTLQFWQSGESLRLLDRPIDVSCPVRLVHGDMDEAVPLEIAFRLMRRLRSSDVQLSVIKGGGHRLSAPHEIDAILRAAAALLEPAP